MITRGNNFTQIDLNVVGSSVFGRYPKISIEKTYNMFESDSFLVPYSGYQQVISSNRFNNGKEGRAIFTSTKFNRIVSVIDNNVYLININYDLNLAKIISSQIINIGQLQTYSGVVYITENNKPQILISDNQSLYIYDTTLSPAFQIVSDLNFTPGYITFHDTYFICAASNDTTYSIASPANNTWRLSNSNQGETGNWPSTSANVGLLQTKPDNVKAVVRFPSKGNMIFVMGSIVTEAWLDTGAQLFPYQRNNQFNIDYGCLSPATVAYMDEIVVWLAQNEKSGPIILYSDGGVPKKITTDGIDFLFSSLQNPQDSQAFLYRQDGHLFYHINFYSDNISLFYDFNTDKFYHASDQDLNYFIAAEVAFFNEQYYFVTRNNGYLFAFDTSFMTYDYINKVNQVERKEIPRIRSCKNIRLPSQDYFIANDVGFTIETGETNYLQQTTGAIRLITQDGHPLISQDTDEGLLVSQDGQYFISQDGVNFLSQQVVNKEPSHFIAQQPAYLPLSQSTPCVDLSISYDGGATFGTEWRYWLPGIGQRRNRLMWWQCGMANDMVCQFKFWSIGRAVCTDGQVNVRF